MVAKVKLRFEMYSCMFDVFPFIFFTSVISLNINLF